MLPPGQKCHLPDHLENLIYPLELYKQRPRTAGRGADRYFQAMAAASDESALAAAFVALSNVRDSKVTIFRRAISMIEYSHFVSTLTVRRTRASSLRGS